MRHETWWSVGLIGSAVLIGALSWRGQVLLLPLAMIFPALWSMAPSRRSAGLVSAAYFLAASRGLPEGVANYRADALYGYALWGVWSWPPIIAALRLRCFPERLVSAAAHS
jgi:hypothetical protein